MKGGVRDAAQEEAENRVASPLPSGAVAGCLLLL
jgi:hypothetical protein